MTATEPALALALEAARELDLDATGAVVIRRSRSTHVDLPASSVVVRVEHPRRSALARRLATVARYLETREVPAARLVLPERQPVELESGSATLWRRLTPLDQRPGPADLGYLARRLHGATTDPPAEIPRFDPYSSIRESLDRIETRGPGEDLATLREELRRVETAFDPAAARDAAGTVLVHGDLHFDNVLMTAEGPTLVDLEDAGRGPAGWDLVPQRTAVRRYGAPEESYREFCRAYGGDLDAWESLEPACRAYELLLIAWAVAYRDASQAMAREAEVRMETLRGAAARTWTLL